MMSSPQHSGMDMNLTLERLRRMAMLDASVFSEIRADTTATVPAILIAVASTLLAGVGGWLWWVLQDLPDATDQFVQSLLIGSFFSLILWVLWLGITYVILTQVFRARADVNDLVRVMGFASAPLAISLFIFLPYLNFGIGVTSLALLFGANMIAVQSVTDASAGKVLAAVAAGFAAWAIVLGLLSTSNDTWAPGFFIFDAGVEGLEAYDSRV